MTLPTPVLTIVVPVHRVEAYLTQCLESMLTGADRDVEVIAVDDASPDGCGAILDAYAARDRRLRVLHLATNVGLGRARNAGLDQARGDYVWFVDSDDWLPPGSVRAVVQRLAATGPDVLVVDHLEVFEDGRTVPGTVTGALGDLTEPVRLADRPELLRLSHVASACTKVVRRSFLDETGLRFAPGWYEDCPFTHPLLMAAGSIDVLNRVCYFYRQRSSGGITKSVSARHFDVFDQYERLFAIVEKAAPEYDGHRPELFRLMINHYLVIAGNERRLPPALRREFFRRAARDYRRRMPDGGYPVPVGLAGLKHRLLHRDAYYAYAALRAVHRAIRRVHAALRRSALRPARPGAGQPGAGAPAPVAGDAESI